MISFSKHEITSSPSLFFILQLEHYLFIYFFTIYSFYILSFDMFVEHSFYHVNPWISSSLYIAYNRNIMKFYGFEGSTGYVFSNVNSIISKRKKRRFEI